MKMPKREEGSFGLGGVLLFGALASVYMINENRSTNMYQSQVLKSNLANLAKQTNETALRRTRSLMKKDLNSFAPISVASSQFVAVAGSGLEVDQGNLLLKSPDPRGLHWDSTALPSGSSELSTKVEISSVIMAAGVPTAVVLKATTETKQGSLTVTRSTKARVNIAALNAPPPITPSSGSPAPVLASNSPLSTTGATATGPAPSPTSPTGTASNCTLANSTGNTSSGSTTGGNTGTATATGAQTGSLATSSGTGSGSCTIAATGGSLAAGTSTSTGTLTNAQSTSVTTPNMATNSSSGSASGATGASSSSGSSSSVGGSSGRP